MRISCESVVASTRGREGRYDLLFKQGCPSDINGLQMDRLLVYSPNNVQYLIPYATNKTHSSFGRTSV